MVDFRILHRDPTYERLRALRKARARLFFGCFFIIIGLSVFLFNDFSTEFNSIISPILSFGSVTLGIIFLIVGYFLKIKYDE